MTKKSLFIAFVVSLGGFLFGFDAGIISGVMSYVGPEFNLNDAQTGWGSKFTFLLGDDCYAYCW